MGSSESKASRNNVHSGGVSVVRATDFSTEQSFHSLRFHNVHGKNVQLSHDNRVAKRMHSFCYGITFSNRPIEIEEQVCIKLRTVESASWSGVMRFGVTSVDPDVNHSSTLPRYACPDLTCQAGYWAKALPEDFAVQGNVLSFYVSREGNLCLSLNNEEQGPFFGEIPTDVPLWVMADIYGNTTALEFVDDERPFIVSHRVSEYGEESPSVDIEESFPAVDGSIENQVRGVYNISPFQQINPVPFADITGEGVELSRDNTMASLGNVIVLQSCLVFSGEPLAPGSTWYLKVLHARRQPFLSIGVTSCDPATLTSEILPLHANTLVDRAEYWVVDKLSELLNNEDFFAISLNPNGFITYQVDNRPIRKFFYCDVSQPLWIIIDLNKNVERILSIGMTEVQLPSGTESAHSSSDASLGLGTEPVDPPNTYTVEQFDVEEEDDEFPPELVTPAGLERTNISHVLVDSDDEEGGEERRMMYRRNRGLFGFLTRGFSRSNPGLRRDSSSSDEYFNTDSDGATPMADSLRARFRNKLDSGESNGVSALASMSIATEQQQADTSTPTTSEENKPKEDESSTKTNECSICCEAVANAAIYDCGHVCLCIDCGGRLVNSQRFPKCPICRNPIKDIMKLYHV